MHMGKPYVKVIKITTQLVLAYPLICSEAIVDGFLIYYSTGYNGFLIYIILYWYVDLHGVDPTNQVVH